MKIGVIGRGFVGGSVEKFLKEKAYHEVLSYDLKDGTDMNIAYERIVKECDVIYVCVPTPMDSEGECYTGIVRKTANVLNFYAEFHDKRPIILLKSTMTPGTTEDISQDNKNCVFVTNPEFLTERNAYEDFKNSKYHVFGTEDEESKELLRYMHKVLWPDSKSIFVSSTEAELIKYITNTYFSVKVTFANHIYQLCQAMGIDYGHFIKSAIEADPRIEKTHWQVPGPDGLLGFGGSCFPKDLNGMINLFNKNEVDCGLLEHIWEYNCNIRQEKEWENLKGRAVLSE